VNKKTSNPISSLIADSIYGLPYEEKKCNPGFTKNHKTDENVEYLNMNSIIEKLQ
jgi:hypothetical protein